MEAAVLASREIGFTIVSMTTSLVAVFIPVLFMGGIVGRLLHELGPGTEATPGPGPGTEVSPGRTIPFGEVTQVIATIQRVIRGNPGVFTSGTESTPGPGPGTEKTPGPGPGTEVSPGRRISIGEMTGVLQLIQRVVRGNPGVFSSGTEFTLGPGPGTEKTPGPGPGTEVSPGRVLSAAELARVLQAIQLVVRKNPGVFSSGTESTPGPGPGTEKTPGPGPGTEVSPGRVISIGEMTRVLEGIQRAVRLNPGAFSSGTEMTPGPQPGTESTPGSIFRGLGYLSVTMEALARYACARTGTINATEYTFAQIRDSGESLKGINERSATLCQ